MREKLSRGSFRHKEACEEDTRQEWKEEAFRRVYRIRKNTVLRGLTNEANRIQSSILCEF